MHIARGCDMTMTSMSSVNWCVSVRGKKYASITGIILLRTVTAAIVNFNLKFQCLNSIS